MENSINRGLFLAWVEGEEEKVNKQITEIEDIWGSDFTTFLYLKGRRDALNTVRDEVNWGKFNGLGDSSSFEK